MDTIWLEDFLTLAETANFSRAAEQRHVTQPAFSRRIKMLEDWVGAALVNRDTHQLALTPAGERFHAVADETLRGLRLGREQAREAAQADATTLRFSSTHALSLTFFPVWLRSLEAEAAVGTVSLTADTMQACEERMLQGRANFLLCHHHPSATTRLEAKSFLSRRLGEDVLVPVSAPGPDGAPAFALAGEAGRPVPFLAYASASGMGRILAGARGHDEKPAWLDPVFTSHGAAILKTMARNGRGIAWSPLSLIEEELAAGSLVRAGEASWDVPMEIRLFRPRARQSRAAEAFWEMLAGR